MLAPFFSMIPNPVMRKPGSMPSILRTGPAIAPHYTYACATLAPLRRLLINDGRRANLPAGRAGRWLGRGEANDAGLGQHEQRTIARHEHTHRVAWDSAECIGRVAVREIESRDEGRAEVRKKVGTAVRRREGAARRVKRPADDRAAIEETASARSSGDGRSVPVGEQRPGDVTGDVVGAFRARPPVVGPSCTDIDLLPSAFTDIVDVDAAGARLDGKSERVSQP